MSTTEHFVGKVAQKALITAGDCILICRDIDDEDIWELPGGRLHNDEQPFQGVQRELQEELGVDLPEGQIMYLEQFFQQRTGERSLLLVYHISVAREQYIFHPNQQEIAEIRWVTKDDIKSYKMYPNCERAIQYYFHNTRNIF